MGDSLKGDFLKAMPCADEGGFWPLLLIDGRAREIGLVLKERKRGRRRRRREGEKLKILIKDRLMRSLILILCQGIQKRQFLAVLAGT